MKVIKEYITSKRGEKLESSQDSYKVNHDLNRYAIADGATREFFSGELAKQLVNHFCCDKNDINKNIFNTSNYKKWLEPVQANWLKFIDNIIQKGKINYIVKNRYNRRDSGASTFIGLEIHKDKNRFKLMIIGDSCLFHIRDGKIIKSYIIEDDSEFNNSPDFFFSRDRENPITPKLIDSLFEEKDYFLLSTDAMAKYILTQKRLHKWDSLWKDLIDEKNNEEWYNDFINKAREDKDNRLDDDDVTILILSTES